MANSKIKVTRNTPIANIHCCDTDCVFVIPDSESDMMSTDAISIMKAMAADAKSRHVLATDVTCLGGLVLLLSNPDTSVVTLSIETLLLLTKDKELCPLVCQCVGILDQLENLIHGQCPEHVRGLADALYESLTRCLTSSSQHLRDCTDVSYGVSNTMTSYASGKACSKSVILKVKGANDQTLVRAITKSMTMSASQVVRDANGDETLINFNSSIFCSTKAPLLEKAESELPPYLPDDKDIFDISEDKSALTKVPISSSESKASKIFTAAASFLSNSFFW